MNLNLRLTWKTLALLVAALAALFGILLAYEAINNVVNPRQDTVFDLCKPEDKKMPDGKAPCRWVIPAKYWPHNDLPRYFEVQVPWADIDPKFPVSAKAWVTFQFWWDDSDYADKVRSKREDSIYFNGFDGTVVYVNFSAKIFNLPNPGVRIYRPLGRDGTMHWIVSLPKLESEEAFELYLKQHIHEIDQKLMLFIDQWH